MIMLPWYPCWGIRMKQYSRYLTYFIIILVVILLQTNTLNDDFATIETFRGGTLEETVFDPMMANSINEDNSFKFSMDGKETPLSDGSLYVDSKMNLLGSLSFIRETFSMSARLYDDNEIKMQRGNKVLCLKINALDATVNGDAIMFSTEPQIVDNAAYVPVSDIAQLFNYGFSFDDTTHMLSLNSEDADKASLPSRFDLREDSRVSAIRDQGDESTCWAYAAIGALESSTLPEKSYEFSPDDLINNKGYSYADKDGGDYSLAAGYFLSWKGPKQSSEESEASVHVQGLKFYSSDDIDKIKWAVFKDGGVSTSLFIDNALAGMHESKYYNPNVNAYCYNGSENPNHDVVIIGWDDNFPKERFKGKARGDGAFICQNSWGESFGDSGVFYVSYFDSDIGDQAVSYYDIESAKNYDEIYQSDIAGWTGQIGYQKENILGANCFKAEADSEIKAAGFYALDKQSFYDVYFVPDYKGVDSLSNRTLVASGSLEDAGYYTVPFSSSVEVQKGEKFAIILSITTKGSYEPMAIEYKSDDIDGDIDIKDGESYISRNGITWESVEKNFKANICLKAYGDYSDEKAEK